MNLTRFHFRCSSLPLQLQHLFLYRAWLPVVGARVKFQETTGNGASFLRRKELSRQVMSMKVRLLNRISKSAPDAGAGALELQKGHKRAITKKK